MKIIWLMVAGSGIWAGLPLAEVGEEAAWRVAERFGLWAALSVVLVGALTVLAWLREKRMAKRIDTLEAQNRETSTEVCVALEKNRKLLEESNKVQLKQLEALQAFTIEMRVRPCLKEHKR